MKLVIIQPENPWDIYKCEQGLYWSVPKEEGYKFGYFGNRAHFERHLKKLIDQHNKGMR